MQTALPLHTDNGNKPGEIKPWRMLRTALLKTKLSSQELPRERDMFTFFRQQSDRKASNSSCQQHMILCNIHEHCMWGNRSSVFKHVKLIQRAASSCSQPVWPVAWRLSMTQKLVCIEIDTFSSMFEHPDQVQTHFRPSVFSALLLWL